MPPPPPPTPPAKLTAEQLHALMLQWGERFAAAGLAGGPAVIDPSAGTVRFIMPMTEQEYRAIAATQDWPPFPPQLSLEFVRELVIPSVDPRAAKLIRHFANERRPTIMQPEAGFSGRIFIRDGCLRVDYRGSKSALVMFHKETGISVDVEGQLVLIDRRTGASRGRVGDMFEWAGPNEAREDMPEVIALHAACGPDPVINAGNPESLAVSKARQRRN